MSQADSIFTSGQDGYHTYRIPSLLVTESGTVLAFCEGRKSGQGDDGKIDVVMRRSFDHGRTWEPMQVIASEGTNTIGNPSPVQDIHTGVIWLLLCWNTEHGHEGQIMRGKAPRDVLVMKSEDDGATWSTPQNITQHVKRPDWTWYATGPCHGIQLQTGRLLIPCNHAVLNREEGKSGPYISHVIYSDDHGETWQLGGDVGPYTNESTVAELEDGSLYINMRSFHRRGRRAYAWSYDSGISWTSPELDEVLLDPVCQGSVLRIADGRILFSNLASERRDTLTIRTSSDGCRTWESATLLHGGPAAYSDLAETKDGTVLCLYECGEQNPYERIALAKLEM